MMYPWMDGWVPHLPAVRKSMIKPQSWLIKILIYFFLLLLLFASIHLLFLLYQALLL